MSIRKFALTFCALAGFSAGAFAQTTSTVTRETSFPAIGLGSGETAQVLLTNLASNSSNGTAASCTVSVSFLNASGTVIGSATTPPAITAGETASVILPYASISGASGRTIIRGVVSLTTSSSTPGPCDLAATMATYDSSGNTHAFIALPTTQTVVIGPGR